MKRPHTLRFRHLLPPAEEMLKRSATKSRQAAIKIMAAARPCAGGIASAQGFRLGTAIWAVLCGSRNESPA